MKRIGTINCGCADNCGKRIILTWSKKNGITAKTPHGKERVDQYYTHKSYEQAVEDCEAMYAGTAWNLNLAE